MMDSPVARASFEVPALAVIAGAATSYLPAISALLACIYYGMQIYLAWHRNKGENGRHGG